jgi:hypothetical protein
MGRLNERMAIVTSGGRGTGRAIAEADARKAARASDEANAINGGPVLVDGGILGRLYDCYEG